MTQRILREARVGYEPSWFAARFLLASLINFVAIITASKTNTTVDAFRWKILISVGDDIQRKVVMDAREPGH